MAKRKGSSDSRPRARTKAAKEGRETRGVESIQHLDKLPKEVWEKILGEFEDADLFPLALSCRYFNQKQRELLERTKQSKSKSMKRRFTLWQKPEGRILPASADYLRFCRDYDHPRLKHIRISALAAYHGHLPLLQEQLGTFKNKVGMPSDFIGDAGESSFAQSRLLFLVRFAF